MQDMFRSTTCPSEGEGHARSDGTAAELAEAAGSVASSVGQAKLVEAATVPNG